jgi:hypothetical protein
MFTSQIANKDTISVTDDQQVHFFPPFYFILFTRSTFGGATLRYRTRQYKIKNPRGQRHDKIQSM